LQGAALEAAANAIVITDRQGRITWSNAAFTRLTGWGVDEARGRNLRILKSGLHDPPFYEELWRTIQSGRTWKREMVNRRKDGSLYIEDQTITPVRRPGTDEITHFIAIKIDVSEQHAARDALLRSERRHRTLAEAAHDDIFMVDREGRLEYVNAAGAAHLGRRPEELVGSRLDEVFSTEIAARLREGVARVLARGEDLYLEHGTDLGGREAWSGTWLTPLEGKPGETDSVLGVSRDITVRVRAEQALRASEERYRSLFERNLAGVYRATLQGEIVECNDAFARIFGYASGAEVQRLGARELYPRPATREALVERLRAAGTVIGHEAEGRTRDGAWIWMLENASLVREGPGAPYIEGTVVDLTERRRLEQELRQAQKMEAVGQFAGSVAHDFSNVLSVIGGYSELALKRVGEEGPLRRSLEAIRASVGRAADLTRQLLAFSRGQVVEPALLDPDGAVRGLEGMLRRLIREDIELVTALKAAPALVRADRGQLEQVILNLVVNARDAMPGGGRLTIETVRTELDEAYCREHVAARPGPYVMLAVTDTGIGMDAETQTHIFEPFFTTKEAGRGTGLGLATVYGIVKRAGGNIWVYSEPGRGSVFKVYLPLVEEGAPSAGPPAGVETAPADVPRGTETILLVEDEEALRTLTRELLESLGYTVLTARHGAEALEVSARHQGRIDLVVTDLVMPELSGEQLAARLGSARPESRVLFVSGYTEDGIHQQGVVRGAGGFLQKPFTSETMGRKIRQVLDDPGRPQSPPSREEERRGS
jgi:PAS domain S-box-containing protein